MTIGGLLEHALESGSLSELRALIVGGQVAGRTATEALWHALRWTPAASLVPACAHLLVHAGANVATPDSNGQTALHLAAVRGHTDALALLLALGGEASDAVDDDGRTALHVAAREADARSVHALLAAGARRFRRDRWKRTPLECLSTGERDSLLVVELLCVQNRSARAISALPASRAPRQTRTATTQTGADAPSAPVAPSAREAASAAGDASAPAAPGRSPTRPADAAVARTEAARGRVEPPRAARPPRPKQNGAAGDGCRLSEQQQTGAITRRAARFELELAAAEAGVPPPADALAPADARLARLANSLRAHVRQAEARQAKLNRAEARVRARLFDLVGLQLAAAARVRAANRALRARLERSLAELGARRAPAAEVAPGRAPVAETSPTPLPTAAPASPGAAHRTPRPWPRGESDAERASPPSTASAREHDHDRLALLLELRRRDLDEREELLRSSEQRLEDQRAALASLLRMLDRAPEPPTLEPTDCRTGCRNADAGGDHARSLWERVTDLDASAGSYASP